MKIILFDDFGGAGLSIISWPKKHLGSDKSFTINNKWINEKWYGYTKQTRTRMRIRVLLIRGPVWELKDENPEISSKHTASFITWEFFRNNKSNADTMKERQKWKVLKIMVIVSVSFIFSPLVLSHAKYHTFNYLHWTLH